MTQVESSHVFIAPSQTERVGWGIACSIALLTYLPIGFITLVGSGMSYVSNR